MAVRLKRPVRGRLAQVAMGAVVVAALTATAVGPAASLRAQEVENVWLTERRVLNFAHGGGLHEAPQGTLYAYKTAEERGADALEMDLHITLDGHVVAIHDSTVDRTTNGTGCVALKTLAEIKALDAAHTFVPGRGPVAGQPADAYPFRGVATGEVPPPAGFSASDFTIATLEEIFQARPDALMLMELKPTEVYQQHDCPVQLGAVPEAERPDLAAEVARLIDQYDMTDQVMVASFIDDILHRFMALAPDVDTSYPLGESIEVYGAYVGGAPFPNPRGHEAMQLPRNYGGIEITREIVDYARANGVAMHFWTINDPDEMQELLDWGVDGIITDRPSVLAGLLPDPVDPTDPTGPVTTSTTSPPGTSSTTSTSTTPLSSTTSTTTDPGTSTTSTTTANGPGAVPAPGAPNPGGGGGGGDVRPSGSGRAPSRTAGPLPRTGTTLAAAWTALALLVGGSGALVARRRAAGHA